MPNTIKTQLGEFSKEKFNALLNVRAIALESFRENLKQKGYTEVTTSSLVNIAGSCENPYASFKLNYYGREAHLSQSAQLQLESLVIRLKRPVFTINNSFREESYDDPEVKGRRLSEFTLIEPEIPFIRPVYLYGPTTPEDALDILIHKQTDIIREVLLKTLPNCEKEIALLGGDINYLEKVWLFNKITYDKALEILNKNNYNYKFGDDLGIKEERQILSYFNNVPTFITHYPASIKFFNMKRTLDGERVYSVDLLLPPLGETIGGAIREENGEKIKQQLLESKIATYIQERNLDPIQQFSEYFSLFEQEEPILRGGFGIGFERFIGFLLNSNDILETIAYRSMQPK